MKNITIYILFFIAQITFSQEIIEDKVLKDSLYLKFKKEVINYSFKEFDALFFEFQAVSNDTEKPILTKEKYYEYTIKIAAFSDRWAILYPKEKEMAEKNKVEWYNKNYSDYLKTKQK